MYAHTLPDRPRSEWESLRDHLHLVGEACARFAADFGWAEFARVAGRLHDIGKCSAEFQTYIGQELAGANQRGPDHSSAGAQEALRLFGPKLGQMLAFIIAGHHAGLADGGNLARRMAKDLPAYDGWQAHVEALPQMPDLAPTRKPSLGEQHGFTVAFLIRMLFSCLVDADRLETASFYAHARGSEIKRVEGTPLPVLRDRLKLFMEAKVRSARADVRAEMQV